LIQSRHWLIFGAIFIVAGVLYNVFSRNETSTPTFFGPKTQKVFDYSMKNIIQREFNAEGKLQSQLQAKQLIHYPETDEANLELPQFKFNKGNTLWSLQADRALYNESQQQLKLLENVTVDSQTQSTQSTHLKTTELTLNILTKQAFSPYPVHIFNDKWSIEGVGLNINLEKQSIEILERVYSSNDIQNH